MTDKDTQNEEELYGPWLTKETFFVDDSLKYMVLYQVEIRISFGQPEIHH